jgi:hypothetical protein
MTWPVIAHWHGEWRTDGFLLTVGGLKAKAAEWQAEHDKLKAVRAAAREEQKRRTEEEERRTLQALQQKYEKRAAAPLTRRRAALGGISATSQSS